MVKKYKNIKPLIIGIGVAGKRHLEAQLNLGITTGIYSTNSQTKQFYRKNAYVIVFDNLKDGINCSNLVHVCTPDDKHTEFVAKAVKKGKAVLCEKSFTTNLQDALYLQSLAHKYKSTLIIGQNYRLIPTFAETRKRVLEGQFGKITHIETTYLHDMTDYQQRYPNGNFLYIGGSHAVDLACFLADEQIISVKATSKNMLSYQIIAEFSSGLKGEIKLDASSPRSVSGSDLKVSGEKGKLVSHNKVDQLYFYKKESQSPQVIKLPNTTTFTIPLEIKIVDDYLSGRTTTHVPLPAVDEAVYIIRILDAIEKAISSGRAEKV